MNIYVVDSYCDDEPQIFTDIVPARDAKDAENQVYAARPYIQKFSAESRTIEAELRHLRRLTKKLENLSIKQAQEEWDAMLNEEGEIR